MADGTEVVPASGRDATQWKPGQSGNPLGRPKGSKNRITLLRQELELQLREQAAPNIGAVLQKAIDMALEGDRAMIKLLLEAHLSRGPADQEKAAEKVEINITSTPPPTIKQIAVIEAEVIENVEPQEADERPRPDGSGDPVVVRIEGPA